MASITERNGRYLVRVRQQGFPTVTKTFTTRSSALIFAKRTEVDMERGKWVAPASVQTIPTLSSAIGTYADTVASKMKGAADCAYRFDKFKGEPFASKPIDKVTPFDLSAWRDELAKTRAPSTVVRLLALMSGVFTWAMKERGWIEENPMSKVRRPRVGDGRSRTFSPAEWDYLMKAARTSKARWLAPALTVLVESAMRLRGELFALRRSDVDYTPCVAYLHETKAGGVRGVPLSPAAVAALQERTSWRRQRPTYRCCQWLPRHRVVAPLRTYTTSWDAAVVGCLVPGSRWSRSNSQIARTSLSTSRAQCRALKGRLAWPHA